MNEAKLANGQFCEGVALTSCALLHVPNLLGHKNNVGAEFHAGTELKLELLMTRFGMSVRISTPNDAVMVPESQVKWFKLAEPEKLLDRPVRTIEPAEIPFTPPNGIPQALDVHDPGASMLVDEAESDRLPDGALASNPAQVLGAIPVDFRKHSKKR